MTNADYVNTILVLFGLLFVLAIVWVVSVNILIRKLKLDHYATYHALGEPRIRSEYTSQELKAFLALITFILKQEHKSLNNTGLSHLCDFMRMLFITFIVGFGVLLAAVILLAPALQVG